MKCGRPKWMLRQLFQVFFLSILLILILATVLVLAYFLYYLPAYPSAAFVSPYQRTQYDQQNQRTFLQGSAISYDNKLGSASAIVGDAIGGSNLIPALNLIPFETSPVRHVSKDIIYQSKQQKDNGEDSSFFVQMGREYQTKCSMFTCFDIHRCGGRTLPGSINSSLSIYIYPIQQWIVDGKKIQHSLSREFYQFLQTIKRSPYYVSDPTQACIFVPSIDLLNLNKLGVSSDDILAALSSLEFWGSAGKNHLLLTLFPGNSPLLHLKTNAIVASSGLFIEHYRLGFHVPVMSPSPLLFFNRTSKASSSEIRKHNTNAITAVAVLQGAFSFDDLFSSANHDNSILLLDYCHTASNNRRKLKPGEREDASHSYFIRCTVSTHNRGVVSEQFEYPDILKEFDFCLVIRDLASPVLWEVMSVGCIPVIIADHQRLPFDELIDWRRTSIQVYEHQMHQLSSILNSVSERRRRRLKVQVQRTFEKYFKDISAISETLMVVLNERVFMHYASSIQVWNGSEKKSELGKVQLSFSNVQSPIFNLLTVSKDSGFTAVILAYDRVTSLFSVIQRVAQVPSLVKIVIIWNNQVKEPPSLDSWPKVGVPVKIIKAQKNKMSNRFFPHDEIETEAVFSLDDDIIMLTVDEIEFGFETWREYPDRIVGFPSRSHVWDNSTHRWKYESEWTSEISMVLTGAAFYHKYWHYAYTNELQRDIRDWVDSKMNCEDIAMNFLVSARTGKSPIKVTPRKKFKCPTCNNNEMLSTDSGHMVERTECINRFTQIMGFMPLISTEFRADPVLFKVDGVPKRLKRYHDMGTL